MQVAPVNLLFKGFLCNFAPLSCFRRVLLLCSFKSACGHAGKNKQCSAQGLETFHPAQSGTELLEDNAAHRAACWLFDGFFQKLHHNISLRYLLHWDPIFVSNNHTLAPDSGGLPYRTNTLNRSVTIQLPRCYAQPAAHWNPRRASSHEHSVRGKKADLPGRHLVTRGEGFTNSDRQRV